MIKKLGAMLSVLMLLVLSGCNLGLKPIDETPGFDPQGTIQVIINVPANLQVEGPRAALATDASVAHVFVKVFDETRKALTPKTPSALDRNATELSKNNDGSWQGRIGVVETTVNNVTLVAYATDSAGNHLYSGFVGVAMNAPAGQAPVTIPVSPGYAISTNPLQNWGPGGGYIFAVDEAKGLYYEAAPIDGIGTWAQAKDGSDALQTGGFDDWVLPSLEELTAMRKIGSISGFGFYNGLYWSADGSQTYATALNPTLPAAAPESKTVTETLHYRPVRKIPYVPATGTWIIGASGYQTLVAKPDATLWSMGINDYGQLGDGTVNDRFSPVQVMSGVKQVATGYFHTLILKSDATLWAVGFNNYGQLGDGTTTTRLTPVKIMDQVANIAAGGYHSLILKTDGSLYATGFNANGQLGDGTTIDKTSPVLIASGVKAITAGYFHSAFLKNDGTVWAMGWNAYGQLGDGTKLDRKTPVQITALGTGNLGLSAGYYHTMFIKADNSLWGTGYNGFGQLGDGTTTQRLAPVQITAVGTATRTVTCGAHHTLIIKTDGSIWAMGLNNFGQLGDGTTIDRSTPVKVAGISAAVSVSAGYYHSVIAGTDGKIWALGYNGYGQLGTGTTQNSLTPVQIPLL